MKVLIGDTGLIGTTLKEKINFNFTFNSKNINEFKKLNIENKIDLYLACLPATKWIVNKNLQQDINNINLIIENIKDIKYNKVILFSTIDVYSETKLLSNEDDIINFNKLSYGSNRYLFEVFIKSLLTFNELKIFRLPALFSKNIKKNILYDLINNNNVYDINKNSYYQWYNLENLIYDINYYIKNYKNEMVYNLFTEPIKTDDIINLFPLYDKKKFKYLEPINYCYKTKFNSTGFIENKENILKQIKLLINEISNK